MKRVVTIQDISCIGKCSLTVALPIISACGVETAVIPTAMLSVHTAFPHFTFHDLTKEMLPTIADWRQHNMTFDAIYTGYLGSEEQIEHVVKIVDTFASDNTLVLVDPVMGDHGKLYTGFTMAFAKKMASLCKKADVIVPNLTEACALLGIPYPETYNQAYLMDITSRLTAFGVKQVVLTGITLDDGTIGVLAYDSPSNTYIHYGTPRIARVFHGTGDTFASALLGALSRDMPLKDALKLAVDFTALSIEKTLNDKDANWYGVNFEQALPWLIEQFK